MAITSDFVVRLYWHTKCYLAVQYVIKYRPAATCRIFGRSCVVIFRDEVCCLSSWVC